MVNQLDGFDCQGCAWPDPDNDRHAAEFCENGAKAVADEATLERAGPAFFGQHTVGELSRRSDHWLGKQGRLTHPMLLDDGGERYRPVSWDDAFGIIADELLALDSPDEAAFYASGRTSNEAAFLYQLFARSFGTNNLPDCSDMCHESSGVALSESLGQGKGTVRLEDFEHATAILVIGQNPGTNHPRMLSSLQTAKRNGAVIVSVNPLPEAGLLAFRHPQEVRGLAGISTRLTDLFVQVRINGDVAFLKGVGKALLHRERAAPGTVFDHAFLENHTEGLEPYLRSLDAVEWDEVVRQSGIARDRIERVAGILAESPRTICCWAMGLTQHRNAVANVQEIVNLMLLRGQVGKTGAGLCPVRGHSNVQGDRTMGILERPSSEFLAALEREFGIAAPREPGMDTVETIHALREGRVKVLFAMGGNFLSATPDTEATAAGLRNARLTVHVSTKLNRAHLVTGTRALILPCLGRSERDMQGGGEQFVTTENSMAVVQQSRGPLVPASPMLLSETAIVARLARRVLGSSHAVAWESLAADYSLIRDSISRVIPGFEDFNERVRKPGGFYLPNPARERNFRTRSGRAKFVPHEVPDIELAEGELLMMTIRSHDQYNTTIYGLDDRYRGVRGGRRVVFMNRDDVRVRSLAAGDRVRLSSGSNGNARRADGFVVVPYDIPVGCCATYFPEANALVPLDVVAAGSNTPASKSVVVRVERS
jgi:molybdopterin-dependent oxidoreductase alpha subunit